MDIVTLEYAASLCFQGMADPNSQMLVFDIKLSKTESRQNNFFILLPLLVGLYRKAQISEPANYRLCL